MPSLIYRAAWHMMDAYRPRGFPDPPWPTAAAATEQAAAAASADGNGNADPQQQGPATDAAGAALGPSGRGQAVGRGRKAGPCPRTPVITFPIANYSHRGGDLEVRVGGCDW